MGKCMSKGSGTRKDVNGKKSRKVHSKSDAKLEEIPDGTSGENSSDLYSYGQDSSFNSNQLMSSPSHNNNSMDVHDKSGPSRPLKKYDRVVWINENDKPEHGTFKWIGKLDGEMCVGLELDNARTVSFGSRTGKKLFGCKKGHRALVPFYQVMLHKDFCAKTAGYTLQNQNPDRSTNPKRKIKTLSDVHSKERKNGYKKAKVDEEEIPSSSQLQSNSSFSQLSVDTHTPGSSTHTNSVTLRKLPPTQRDPTWSPGDKIKFRNSKEEAEILETRLEGDDLITKIKYTDESSRAGQIESSQLIDIMASCNLVRPPILHDSLRRRSFLEAVVPYHYEFESVTNKRARKDEGVQVESWNLLEVLTPPPFLPVSPTTAQRNFDIETPPPRPQQFNYPTESSTTCPYSVDVIDNVRPWSSMKNEEDLNYSLSWSESFRKSQKDAALVGATKMRELKEKQDKSRSSTSTGDASNNISSDDTKNELDRAFLESPIRNHSELHVRPLESPTLVKNICRRNTYPLIGVAIPAEYKSFSTQRSKFFEMNPVNDNAKIVGAQMKQTIQPEISHLPANEVVREHKNNNSCNSNQPVEAEGTKQDGSGEGEIIPVSCSSNSANRREILAKEICPPRQTRKFNLDAKPEFVVPPFTLAEFQDFKGYKGIQGRMNSCYLDSTITSFFAFTNIFDSCLMDLDEEIELDQFSNQIRNLLAKYIVNELRTNYYCPAKPILYLRKLLSTLNSKIMSSFMDPEEFIFILLDQVLHLPEFIHYDNGVSDFLFQINLDTFINPHPYVTTQRLLDHSLKILGLKFKKIPSPALILEMPRSGGQLLNGLKGIIPKLSIDITNLVVDAPRSCGICSKPASVECMECFDLVHHTENSTESTSFCSQCYSTFHSHPKRSHHKAGTRILQTTGMRIKMELLAVICFRACHFVTFVRTQHETVDAPWVFFDSNPTGKYPIYEILPDMGKWLIEIDLEMEKELFTTWRNKPPMLKRIVEDGHICIYHHNSVVQGLSSTSV